MEIKIHHEQFKTHEKSRLVQMTQPNPFHHLQKVVFSQIREGTGIVIGGR